MNAVNASHPVVGPVSLVDTGHLDISDISNLSQASMHIDTISPLDRYTLGFDNAFDPSLLDHVQLVNGPERQDTAFYWSVIDPTGHPSNNEARASRLPSFWTPDDVGITGICIGKLSDLSVRVCPVSNQLQNRRRSEGAHGGAVFKTVAALG